MDRHSKVKTIARGRSWALPRERDFIFLILKVKDTFPTTHAQKVSSEVKGRGRGTTP